jgi:hypothetical protein
MGNAFHLEKREEHLFFEVSHPFSVGSLLPFMNGRDFTFQYDLR